MTEPAIDLLIDTSSTGEDVAILAEGGKDRDFRRLSNTLRGAGLHVVQDLIAEVRRTGQTQQRQVSAPASTVLSKTLAAAPVIGVGGGVFAVQLAPTVMAAELGASEVAVWEWEVGLQDLPPRLWLDERFLNMTGTDPQYRDRTGPYGPVDFFRPVVRLRDILYVWQRLKTIKVGDTDSGQFVVRTVTGQLRNLYWAQRCVDTPAGPRVRGLCRESGSVDSADMYIDLIEMRLIDKLMHLHDRPGDDSPGVFGAVGDITYPNAPTIIRWLTPYIPTIGHGVSTGQTPAIHPDSLMKIPGWLEAMKDGPVTDIGVTRRGNGGWLKVLFHADILDREFAPTIGAMIVYPGDVSVIEPGDAPDQ